MDTSIPRYELLLLLEDAGYYPHEINWWSTDALESEVGRIYGESN